jgi:8-oxo-dGTP diphosphatase
VMIVYACRSWAGTLHGREGQPLQWCTQADLAALPMPPADLPVVAALASMLP